MSLTEKAFVLGQYALPHHFLSRLMGKFTYCENPTIKNLMIRKISTAYNIDLSDALEPDAGAYRSFNEFFTRPLKPGARPIAPEANSIASPADGFLSQKGPIQEGSIIQAKGFNYTVDALLGGDEQRAAPFQGGTFATIYLSPRDYHRLHMPLTGTLKEMIHVPGRLFSVNDSTTRNVPGLFARNERVVAIFDTAAGPMALILVGAIFVASIETVWHGVVTPPTREDVLSIDYEKENIVLEKGAEMGRFNMGSTIVVLFGNPKATFDSGISNGSAVRMGSPIGSVS
ncbi:MAG: phosphatidylserine decarboxylase [Pseudomonadota bacterium]|jgi:phosphatidylserine decarboxylase